MNGKIASLPNHLRQQLNRRLDDAEPHQRLLTWLNSLPEVQRILAADFAGRPISKQNLHEWSLYGFRNWKMRQNALDFATLLDTDVPAGQPAPAPSLPDKLVQWLALRFAACAQSLAPADQQPDQDLRRLRYLAADIFALRRGDLYSRRVALEERRLALLQAAADDKRAKAQAVQNALRSVMRDFSHTFPERPNDLEPTDEIADPATLI